jgi:tetratricopeptide (TPR) repeat protein
MVSRLLSALDARIARTRDPLQNDCLRAERTTLLARQGHLEEARAELARIRARHAAKPNAVLTAWVCLGEGMVDFFKNLTPTARDRFLRAHALASTSGSRSVRCISAGWLAHFSYLDQDFQPMTRYIDIVLAEGSSNDSLAMERVCLVVGQAYHWSDRFDLAQPWYERARWHANSIGDQTLLSALLHNMAWLHVAHERRRSLVAQIDEQRASRILFGAEATQSFDALVGTASLKSLVPILHAHVLSLLGRYEDALELFAKHLGQALIEGLSRIECSVLAEVAWCQVSAGSLVERKGRSRQVARVQSARRTCRYAWSPGAVLSSSR